MSDADLHQLIAQAISDPGAFLPRGDDFREPIVAWGARAVMKALREKGIIQ